MKLTYAGEKLETSKFNIFLAGPTPREVTVKSWRPDFVKELKRKKFKGSAFLPENRIIGSPYDFDTQISWEVSGLKRANLIVFWIPRNLKDMPAFTTNIEFGEFMHSGKIVVGFPPESVNNRYIKKRCEMHDIPLFHTIEEIVDYVCEKEFIILNMCEKCSGDGFKESNGQPYKCNHCDGEGYLKKYKKSKKD